MRCRPIPAPAITIMPSAADFGSGRALSRTPALARNHGLERSAKGSEMVATSETDRLRTADRLGAWQALETHYEGMRNRQMRDLFAREPGRGERMTAEAAGVFLDYSKNRVDEETLSLLVALAEQSGLRERIDAMFRGEKINVTENRFDHRRRKECRAGGPCRARQDGRLRQSRSRRPMERTYRKAHSRRDQYL